MVRAESIHLADVLSVSEMNAKFVGTTDDEVDA